MTGEDALILVVDDNEMNRDMLSRRLERQGYRPMLAEDGLQALEMVRAHSFDLILLDIMMPRLNGYQFLEQVKADAVLRHIPVIVISAVDDLDSVVKCIEMGAEDYLFKPFNPILLKARIGASLEKKRLLDQERQHHPATIQHENGTFADFFPQVTALSAGVVGLGSLPPEEAAHLLNDLFAAFDALAGDLYHAKLPGGLYLAVGGAPSPHENQAEAVAVLARGMRQQISGSITLQIGIHTGPAAGGLIGSAAPSYHLWGEALEVADRLRLAAPVGGLLVSAAAVEALAKYYTFADGGLIEGLPTYCVQP
ncbi:MAG: response regulator [Chloroflexi bacterium]|nr:response regulator [Chloroflexota bacterium]